VRFHARAKFPLVGSGYCVTRLTGLSGKDREHEMGETGFPENLLFAVRCKPAGDSDVTTNMWINIL
jgi:hypothetical protein